MGMKAVAAKAIGENVDYSLLTDPTELALSRKLNELTDLIASCARDRAPFRPDALCPRSSPVTSTASTLLPGSCRARVVPSTPSFRVPVWPLAMPSA